MINTEQWKPFYKRSPDAGYHDVLCETNLLYTPLISPDKTIMCMSWDATSQYQHPESRPLYNQQLLDYFFDKEVKYLNKFKHYPFTPEVYGIDYDNKKVFIEWPGETCNDIVYNSSRDIYNELPDWEDQLRNIVKTIYQQGVYKVSLYPHCFYIHSGTLKTFDWYGCFDIADCLVDYNIFKGMTGKASVGRFNEALMPTGQVDFGLFFFRALEVYIKWPGDPFTPLLREI